MIKQALYAMGVVLTAILIMPSMSQAQEGGCTSPCVRTAGSHGGGTYQQIQGQSRANDAAGERGAEGRAHVGQKQQAQSSAGRSSSSSSSVQSQPSAPMLDPSKMDPKMTPPTCSLC